jgi:Zn-dependent protease with chaperone function
MQDYVGQLFMKTGQQNKAVDVEPISSSLVAYATGFNIEWFFGIFPVSGVIHINENYLQINQFTDSEIKFILAHEFTHIYKSHYVARILGYYLEQFAKGENNKYYYLIELLKWYFKPGAILIKEQEYDADYEAVQLTADKNSAISCLKKLVKYDLNAPSHSWELLGFYIPAMTMGERITELYTRIKKGYTSIL